MAFKSFTSRTLDGAGHTEAAIQFDASSGWKQSIATFPTRPTWRMQNCRRVVVVEGVFTPVIGAIKGATFEAVDCKGC